MSYQFPATIFVKTTTIREQFDHIRSEIDEIEAAFEQVNLPHAVHEIYDAHGSLETLTRKFVKLARDQGIPINPAAVRMEVEEKNRRRSYYEES